MEDMAATVLFKRRRVDDVRGNGSRARALGWSPEAAMSLPTVGRRGWRDARRVSQMELSLEADVSTRHLSFVEPAAQPSRELIVRLAEHLDAARAQRTAAGRRLRARVPGGSRRRARGRCATPSARC
jgi:hypothetical protein